MITTSLKEELSSTMWMTYFQFLSQSEFILLAESYLIILFIDLPEREDLGKKIIHDNILCYLALFTVLIMIIFLPTSVWWKNLRLCLSSYCWEVAFSCLDICLEYARGIIDHMLEIIIM